VVVNISIFKSDLPTCNSPELRLCTVRWENHLPALNSKNSITSMNFVSEINTSLYFDILKECGTPGKLSGTSELKRL
jgi:hypothetical protein